MASNSRVRIHEMAEVSITVQIRGQGAVLIGEYCVIEDHVLLDSGMSRSAVILIEPRSKVKYGAVLRAYDGYIRIGQHSSIGEYSVLAGHGGLEVGAAVIIGGHCYLSAADHIYWGDGPIRFQGETTRGIRVGEGAWLGARTVVLDGVKIGERCVIGAGSVVTKDLHADMVCVGTPCREVRARVHEFE